MTDEAYSEANFKNIYCQNLMDFQEGFFPSIINLNEVNQVEIFIQLNYINRVFLFPELHGRARRPPLPATETWPGPRCAPQRRSVSAHLKATIYS